MELDQPPLPTESSVDQSIHIAEERVGVEEYLALYRMIGDDVQWDERLRQPKEDVSDHLKAASTAVYVLRRDGSPIGLCELDCKDIRRIELKHFGLIPSERGKGLGPILLRSALSSVWRQEVCCVWLHTDTNDDASAIHVYQRAGFRIVRRDWQEFAD